MEAATDTTKIRLENDNLRKRCEDMGVVLSLAASIADKRHHDGEGFLGLVLREVSETGLKDVLVLTRGICFFCEDHPQRVVGLIHEVANYSDFSESIDPYGEHEMGVFEWYGRKCFWKVDFQGGHDGINRILTILFAEEY